MRGSLLLALAVPGLLCGFITFAAPNNTGTQAPLASSKVDAMRKTLSITMKGAIMSTASQNGLSHSFQTTTIPSGPATQTVAATART